MTRVISILAAAAVVAAGAGCRSRDDGVPRASGYVEATEVRVAAEVGGRVVEMPAEEGKVVAAGDVLARLDTSDLEITLRRAEADRDQAGAQLQLAAGRVAGGGHPPGQCAGRIGQRRHRRRRGGAEGRDRGSSAVRGAARRQRRVAQAAGRCRGESVDRAGARHRRTGAGPRRGRRGQAPARRRAARRGGGRPGPRQLGQRPDRGAAEEPGRRHRQVTGGRHRHVEAGRRRRDGRRPGPPSPSSRTSITPGRTSTSTNRSCRSSAWVRRRRCSPTLATG